MTPPKAHYLPEYGQPTGITTAGGEPKAQAPREFWLEETMVTIGSKAETKRTVYLQEPNNAASNEYHHGDVYYHVIEISALDQLREELAEVTKHDSWARETIADRNVEISELTDKLGNASLEINCAKIRITELEKQVESLTMQNKMIVDADSVKCLNLTQENAELKQRIIDGQK